MPTVQQILTERTCKLINDGKRILLKRKDGTYLHQWTNIAAGPDSAHWTGHKNLALEIFCLRWAFALAKLYKCKVVSTK